jgi:WD40 repeat protein
MPSDQWDRRVPAHPASDEAGAANRFDRELDQILRTGESDAPRDWRQLARLAVEADAVPRLFATLCASGCSATGWMRCHNALAAAGTAGRRWADVLRAAGVLADPSAEDPNRRWTEPPRGRDFPAADLSRLWTTAAGLGLPPEDVERLRRLAASAPDALPLELGWPAPLTPPGAEPVVMDHTCVGRTATTVPGPDGSVVLAVGGDDGGIRLWDLWTGEAGRAVPPGHRGPIEVMCPVPLPDGTLLATGGADGTVRCWDPASGEPVGEPLRGHVGPVRSMCTVQVPGGRSLLVSGGQDATVRRFDPVTGRPVGEPLTGHTRQVPAMCPVPLPDGTVLLATGGGAGVVCLWDPATGEQVRTLPAGGDRYPVEFLAVLPGPDGGGPLLMTCVHGEVPRLWEVATGQPLPDRWAAVPPIAHPARRLLVVRTGAGRVLAAAGRSPTYADPHYPNVMIDFRDPYTGELVRRNAIEAGPDTSVHPAALPDGGTVLLGCDPKVPVRVWDATSALDRPVDPSVPAGWPADVERLYVVTAPGRPIALCAIGNNRMQSYDPVGWHPVGVQGGAYEVDDAFAATLADGSPVLIGVRWAHLIRWDPWTGAEFHVTAPDSEWGPPACPVTRPDGSVVIAMFCCPPPDDGDDEVHDLCLVNPVDGNVLGNYPVDPDHGTQVLCEVPLPDGRRLLAVGGHPGVIRLWSLDGELVSGHRLAGDDGNLNALCALAMPDGAVLLASGAANGTIRIWDPVAGTAVGAVMTGHVGPIQQLCPVTGTDGRVFLASSDGNTVRLWDVLRQAGVATVAPPGGATGLAVLPDGRLVTSAANRPLTIRITGPGPDLAAEARQA